MKAGFTLIELLITILIASIIGTALFTAYTVINRSLTTVDVLIARDTRLSIITYYMERDLYGTCMLSLDTTATTTLQKKDVEKKPTKSEQPEIFISKNNKSSLQSLTFVSNNPLPTYHKEGAGSRLVQIIYSVIPEQDNQDSFSLVRQETVLPAYKDVKQPAPKKYTLASGIKNITMQYAYKESQVPAKGDKAQAPEIITTTQWPPAQETAEKKKTAPPFPQFIIMQLSLWEHQYTTVQDFAVSFEIPIQAQPPKPAPAEQLSKEQKTKEEEPKKEAAQPAKPSTQPPTRSPIVLPSPQEISRILQEASLKK